MLHILHIPEFIKEKKKIKATQKNKREKSPTFEKIKK